MSALAKKGAKSHLLIIPVTNAENCLWCNLLHCLAKKKNSQVPS
jgi:hypothetical protein